SKSGSAYVARLRDDNTVHTTIYTMKSPNPGGGKVFTNLGNGSYTGPGMCGGPDQPWVDAIRGGDGKDRIYAAFNDLSKAATNKTASIMFSTDNGSTFNNGAGGRKAPLVLERSNLARGDNAPVRVATTPDMPDRVYAAFERIISPADNNPPNFNGQVVVVRDDMAGAGGFKALGGMAGLGTNVFAAATTSDTHRLPDSGEPLDKGGAPLGARTLAA